MQDETSFSPRENGFESLIGFKICFKLDDAVMLEPVASVFVGLTNWGIFLEVSEFGGAAGRNGLKI